MEPDPKIWTVDFVRVVVMLLREPLLFLDDEMSSLRRHNHLERWTERREHHPIKKALNTKASKRFWMMVLYNIGWDILPHDE
eukprot:scaffold30409_cov85-Amphora_coffeaeformis.AAC.1